MVIASPATTLAPRADSNRSMAIESVSTTSIEPVSLLASKMPTVVFTEILSWASSSNRSAVIEPFSPVITVFAMSSACSGVTSETIVIASPAVTLAPRAASRRSILIESVSVTVTDPCELRASMLAMAVRTSTS